MSDGFEFDHWLLQPISREPLHRSAFLTGTSFEKKNSNKEYCNSIAVGELIGILDVCLWAGRTASATCQRCAH